MKTKNLLMITALLLGGCEAGRPVESGAGTSDYYSERKTDTPKGIFQPVREFEYYVRGANGELIRQEGLNDLQPVDSSGAYFRMTQRTKKLPGYRTR